MATKRGSGRSRPARSSSRPPHDEAPSASPSEEEDDELFAAFEDAVDLDDLESLPPGELADLVIATFDAVVPRTIRRALATGLGAILLTEEGVRRTIQDLREDPKDLVQALGEQAERAREGVSTATSRELLGLLKRVDGARDLRKLLHGVTLELTMQVRLSSDEEEENPPTRSGIRARIRRKPRS